MKKEQVKDPQEVLYQQLLADIEKLKETQLASIEPKLQQQKVEDILNNIKNNVAIEVHIATDDRGKKLFSNETFRQAEITKRLSESTEYQELLTKAQELETTVLTNRFEIEYLRNKISVNKEYLYCVYQCKAI